MASSAKRRQTMAKMTRERKVKEKRERKQEKKEAKKLAAAMEADGALSVDEIDGGQDVATESLADAAEDPAVS